MIGNVLSCTFKTKGSRFMEVDALIEEDQMRIRVRTSEENAGKFTLLRVRT
jgi:hypothetical protein